MLNEMERRALDMLLAGDKPELAVFRAQLNAATVASRKFTGVGFFTRLSVSAELPRVKGRARFSAQRPLRRNFRTRTRRRVRAVH
jgi:hypothetical protein